MALPDKYYPLPRESVLPSFFMQRLQDFLSGVGTNLRVTLKNTTTVQVVPDAELGIAAIALDGQWRFNDASVTRAHPGGAKGTYVLWAVGTDLDVDNSPDPFTDHTVYTFDLRITSGANPAGEGVEVFEKIAEIDWDGAAIEALRQTHGTVTGAMLSADALSSASGDITWTRDSSGGWIANNKADSITANELADNAVDTNALVALAVTTAKIANLAVTGGKIANHTIGENQIVLEGITRALMQAGAIGQNEIAVQAVATKHIVDLAVTTIKIALEAVDTAQLKDKGVTTAKLAELGVTAAKLAADAVETAKIKDKAITPAKMGVTHMVKVKNLGIILGIPVAPTYTTLTWPEEVYDTSAMHSTIEKTGELFAPVKGLYLCTAFLPFDGTANLAIVNAYKNASTDPIARATAEQGTAGGIAGQDAKACNLSFTVALEAGDSVRLKATAVGGEINYMPSGETGHVPPAEFSLTFLSAS